MTRLDEIAQAFAALCDRLDLPYAIMGGLAVRAYGLPRPTFDVDFTVVIARDELAKLYHAAEELGFSVPTAQAAGWVDEVRGLPVVKFQRFIDERAIDVDVFLAETPFQSELIARRVRHEAGGWSGWFVTPEDLILLKLLADRPKDRTDIADILLVQGQVDQPYLRRWANELGLVDSLEDLLK